MAKITCKRCGFTADDSFFQLHTSRVKYLEYQSHICLMCVQEQKDGQKQPNRIPAKAPTPRIYKFSTALCEGKEFAESRSPHLTFPFITGSTTKPDIRIVRGILWVYDVKGDICQPMFHIVIW